jgi:hypothetical protein
MSGGAPALPHRTAARAEARRTTISMLLAALAYMACSIVLTWPVVVHPGEVLFGDYGDTRGWAWDLWTRARHLTPAQVDALQAAPFGIGYTQSFTQPIAEWIPAAIAAASNEIVAINLFILFCFPLTALATYFLLVRALGDPMAAFFGGLAFGFCPASVMQAAGGHASYALNAFQPLFLLALLHNRSVRTWRTALWVALAFSGVALTSLYFGYFACYVAILFFAFDYLTQPAPGIAFVRNYAACTALVALILLPIEFAAIREQLTPSLPAANVTGQFRDFSELTVFSARPWNYLVPAIDHPVMGTRFENFVRNNLHGSNAFEQTLYLGWCPIALLIVGCVLLARWRLARRSCALFVLFACGATFMYFLSLPPIVGGVPSLSYFAYDLAPMFRVYARSGIFVALFVACAAAVVLSQLRHMLPARGSSLLMFAATAVLTFEFLSVPPGYARPQETVPEVYRWLSQEPGDIVVAVYPMIRFDEAASYTYPFWQRIHGKRLVNGATPANPRAWAFYEGVRDLSHADAPRLLREAGVKYIIVHRAMFKDGPIPPPIKRYYSPARAALTENGGVVPAIPYELTLHATFGSDQVFTWIEAGEPPRGAR